MASQVALHAGAGGIVPELAARAHLRWLDPSLDEVLADAGATLARRGLGRRHGRARPRRLPARRPLVREGARLGARRAARRGQPPRGPPVRRLAPGSRRARASGAGLPARGPRRLGRPHLPRRDARPPRLPAARRDGRRRGRRGLRQGRPAPGPRVSRRAGDRAGRRRSTAAGSPADRLPRAWLGDSYDFSFSGLKTALRRLVEAELAAAGLPVDGGRGPPRRRRASPRSPRRSRRASWTSWPRRRCGRRRRSAPGRSSSAAAWPRTRRCAARLAAGAAGLGRRPRDPAAGALHRQRGDDRGRRRPAPRRRRDAPGPTSAPAPRGRWRDPPARRPRAARPPAGGAARAYARARDAEADAAGRGPG